MITEVERATNQRNRRTIPTVKDRPLPMKSPILTQHGAQEMDRRKRQIINGQLKSENGLV